MDPVIEEFCRAHELRPEVFRRMQRYFRDILTPKLHAIDELLAEVTLLRAELAALKADIGPKKPRGVPA
jgi:hypothetical protein